MHQPESPHTRYHFSAALFALAVKMSDFQLFKDSRVHVKAETVLEADTGYQGLDAQAALEAVEIVVGNILPDHPVQLLPAGEFPSIITLPLEDAPESTSLLIPPGRVII